MGHPKIIALDLGKFKTVGCVMPAGDPDAHAFETVESTPQSLHDLVVRHVTPEPADPAQTLVVFETCDSAGWVHDVCVTLGVQVVVTHANGEAWRWRRVRRKTDRDDDEDDDDRACRLAHLARSTPD